LSPYFRKQNARILLANNALEGLRRKGLWGPSGQGLISRVFFYEFLESGGDGWGIVKAVGGQFIPKPAYYAYQRYIGAHP
jgi:hypothetical protein